MPLLIWKMPDLGNHPCVFENTGDGEKLRKDLKIVVITNIINSWRREFRLN
jgi:hypothetical protein